MSAEQHIYDRVSTLYTLIPVESWEYNFNHRCHINAYHYAKKKGYDIASCICVSDKKVCAHFINYDKKAKKYIDNTVWEYRCYQRYYIVKHFTIEEFANPNAELTYLKKEIYNLLPWRYKMSPFITAEDF